MSDSESDLDFESADEDAEFTSSIKSKVSQKSISNKESFSKGGDALSESSIKTDDTEAGTNKDECNSMHCKQEFSKTSAETVEDQVKLKASDETLDSKISVAIPNSDGALTETESKTHQHMDSSESVSYLKSDAQATNLQPTRSLPAEPQRERVVLRLEKKKQQLKEPPAEIEKPSDFVNILKDPNEKRQSSTWGFGSWGSSLLSSAASSVSTFSNQVSQGIGTVLETVENTLGAPPPEELAQTLNEKKVEAKEVSNIEEENEKEGISGILPNVSSWAKVLENSGSQVIMGGLGALELIGKKTMDILTEGDPGFRKKRAAFSDGANLSELLKEIKARADEHSKENSEDDAENMHYSQIFDEKQGLVHLEALEMLSKQSQAKFQRLLMRHSKHLEVKKRLEEIKSICENIPSLDDHSDCEHFEDFDALFKKYTLELSFPLNVDNIIKTQKEINKSISDYENAAEDNQSSPKVIYQSAICSLADFTAKCIETFHKAAELLLVQPNLDPDLESYATNLTGLTTVMCIEVNNLSSRYHKCLETTVESLKKKGVSENVDVQTLATNVYVEASNSNNYIQDAYQMLVPVLQVRFLEAIN